MQERIAIRDANESDISSITNIYNDVIASSNAIYREDSVPESERLIWYLDKKANNFPVIVAVLNEKVIGYGVFGTFRFGEGYNHTVEHSVHVASDHRGRGIGKQILERLISLATEQKRRVMVAAIDSTNVGSIALHLKYGFVETARMPHVAQKKNELLDLVLMQKAL
jgi:phosphinothricin acetyltransferase